ncbi:MAG: hypothetical protein ACK5LS_02250 [Propioniciclava sp.]
MSTVRGVARTLTWMLVAFQAAQGGWPLRLEPFMRSYWVIDYSQGFVRRGLAGELVDLLPGATSSPQIVAAVWFTTLASLAAIIGLIVLLQRRGHDALALLLAASPFIIDQLSQNRRPDQWGVVILVLAGLMVAQRWRGARWWGALAGLGVMQAALTLIHEASLFLTAVWVFPLIMSRTDLSRRARWGSVVAFVAPSVAPAVAVLRHGRASAEQMSGLADRAVTLGLLTPDEAASTMISYLNQTVADSAAMVAGFTTTRILMVVLWAAIMVAVHLIWLRPVDIPWWSLIPVALGTAVVFATSLDWPRWTTMAGTCLLVVAGSLALPRPPRPVEVWMLPLAVYLATRAALLPNATPATWVSWLQYWVS